MNANLRPCLANGIRAMFHQWANWKDIILSSKSNVVLPRSEFSLPIAIVEYKDGTVALVHPSVIRFIDTDEIWSDIWKGY